jgi:hypothetical protein
MQSYQIDNLIESAIALIVLGWLGWLIRLAALSLRRSEELRHELRLRLLERCSAAELVEVLGTVEGREWMGRFLSGGVDPAALDESTLQRAVALIGVGLACGVAAAVLRFPGARALAVGGSFAIAWGLAVLAARWWLQRRRRAQDKLSSGNAAADHQP